MRWKRQWIGMGQGHLKSISSSCAVCFCDGINRLYCNFFYHNLNCHNANFIITLIILWFVKSKFGRWLQKKKNRFKEIWWLLLMLVIATGFICFFSLRYSTKIPYRIIEVKYQTMQILHQRIIGHTWYDNCFQTGWMSSLYLETFLILSAL